MIDACVVDASVGIKLFVMEESSETADGLFGQLSEDSPARFHVPDLFYVECADILWKYVRRFGYPAESARQDVADLAALALELALAYGITAYDACYAALSRQLALPLVTADAPLARKLAGSDVSLLTLQQL